MSELPVRATTARSLDVVRFELDRQRDGVWCVAWSCIDVWMLRLAALSCLRL